MNLTPHFTLQELTRTDTCLPNIPSDFELARLRRLSEALEKVREAMGGLPITINSGFRSMLVNHAVGGASSSAHLRGDAADFVCPQFGAPAEICLSIIDAGIEFDQLICESMWVHFGLSDKPRQQVMTALPDGRYTFGIRRNI